MQPVVIVFFVTSDEKLNFIGLVVRYMYDVSYKISLSSRVRNDVP